MSTFHKYIFFYLAEFHPIEKEKKETEMVKLFWCVKVLPWIIDHIIFTYFYLQKSSKQNNTHLKKYFHPEIASNFTHYKEMTSKILK